MKIKIHDSIKYIAPDCRLGSMVVKNVVVKGTPLLLTRECLELQAEIAAAYNLDILPKVPRVVAVRNMYRRLHFDPSRYRPASEALVRRVLQKKALNFVNSAVDVNNYCSLRYFLPCGLYDLDRIEGEIVYKLATEGTYVNIAGNDVSTGGKPFLSDDCGVFGNPTSDSRRTAVTLETRTLLLVIYADTETSDAELNDMLLFAGDMFVRFNEGAVFAQNIFRD
jgi:DNA/RNA-binding domain of Phe-tRNA-synthetase-like protein